MPHKMEQKLPISVFIIARDEEDRIVRAINSVRDWVDEIIVVDSGSIDNTVKVSEDLGAKVIAKDWPGYGPQKRFAEEQCRHKWVLNLDADEEISPALSAEIRELFQTQPPVTTAYKLKIQDVYPHQTEPGMFPYTYRVVRLYNLDQGRYSDSPIHDRVVFNKPTDYVTLKGRVNHYSIRSLSQMISKINRYTDLQADVYTSGGRKVSGLRLVYEYPFSFFKAYIVRGHILRGLYGLVLANHYAYTRFMRIAKMWEKQLGKKR